MLIDLHTHTMHKSYDSAQSLEELIIEAKSLQLDAICLTEHDEFWNIERLVEISRYYEFLVLPGSEVNTDNGHFLTFGLEKYVFGMHKVGYLKGLVEDASGVLIGAHPYRRNYVNQRATDMPAMEMHISKIVQKEAYQICDALEVFNGRSDAAETRFSLKLSEYLGKPQVAGSDSHKPGDLGNVATLFHRRIRNLEDLIEELKAGRFTPIVIN